MCDEFVHLPSACASKPSRKVTSTTEQTMKNAIKTSQTACSTKQNTAETTMR